MSGRVLTFLVVANIGLIAVIGLGQAQDTSGLGGNNAVEASGAAQKRQQPPFSPPTPDVLLMLVRTTLVALNQANFTGNYSVLRDLGTLQLQATNSQAQLAIEFTKLREQRLDLSRVLLLTPDLVESPGVYSDGTLRLAGLFQTSPVQISFTMAFRPVAGVWRIDGLLVRTLPAPASAATLASGRQIPMPVRKTH